MKTIQQRIKDKLNMIWTRQEFSAYMPYIDEAIREHEMSNSHKHAIVLGGANEAVIVHGENTITNDQSNTTTLTTPTETLKNRNISPKEKANELIRKYKSLDIKYSSYEDGDGWRECVLITIDEIIKETLLHDKTTYQHGRTAYWIEVKNELLKL